MEGENIISDSDSKILRIEVEAAIKEVAFAVDYVELSRTLPCTDNLVYFNLRTKESEVFCVELTVQGFRIVSRQFDKTEDDDGKKSQFYETIYALLDNVSPEYRKSFADVLMSKLNQLQALDETDMTDS